MLNFRGVDFLSLFMTIWKELVIRPTSMHSTKRNSAPSSVIDHIWLSTIFAWLSCLIISTSADAQVPDICEDGLDNDGDSLIDCEDPDWIGISIFIDSGQALGSRPSLDVSLGDVDGDGDLDAWVANFGEPKRVWLNEFHCFPVTFTRAM